MGEQLDTVTNNAADALTVVAEAHEKAEAKTQELELKVANLQTELENRPLSAFHNATKYLAPEASEEYQLLKGDMERRACTVDNALRLQEIAEEGWKECQERLEYESQRRRRVEELLRNLVKQMEESRESDKASLHIVAPSVQSDKTWTARLSVNQPRPRDSDLTDLASLKGTILHAEHSRKAPAYSEQRLSIYQPRPRDSDLSDLASLKGTILHARQSGAPVQAAHQSEDYDQNSFEETTHTESELEDEVTAEIAVAAALLKPRALLETQPLSVDTLKPQALLSRSPRSSPRIETQPLSVDTALEEPSTGVTGALENRRRRPIPKASSIATLIVTVEKAKKKLLSKLKRVKKGKSLRVNEKIKRLEKLIANKDAVLDRLKHEVDRHDRRERKSLRKQASLKRADTLRSNASKTIFERLHNAPTGKLKTTTGLSVDQRKTYQAV